MSLRAVITILVPSFVLWLGHRTYSHYSNHLPSSHYSNHSPSSSSALREQLEVLQEEIDNEAVTPQDYFAHDQEHWLYYPAQAGLMVTGWPSQGGVYKLDICSRLELEFLGLDLFNDTLRPSTSDPEWQSKENAHCDRSMSMIRYPVQNIPLIASIVRRLGPTWWESNLEYSYNQLKGLSGYAGAGGIRRNNYIRVGWPTGGGVWVWQPKDETEAKEKGGAKLQNANTMDERCELIKSLGGAFYADPQSCPYLDLP